VICLLALAAVIAVAVLTPLPPVRRVLRPLANVGRLTSLPLYRSAALARYWSLVATAVLLVVLFASAGVTSARPIGFDSATKNFETLHPQDVMVCIGQPVTDASTAGLLNYYGEQLRGFDNQRIGLTSPTLRVVPLTRDYVYAAATFGEYATLAGIKRSIDAKQEVANSQIAVFNHALSAFSRPVTYIDYAQSMEDVLALCMAGFPSFEGKSNRRRSLIYMGYTNFRGSAETRATLFSTQQIKDMALSGGIQINGIARTDVASADPAVNESLASIVASTGGHFSSYNPAGTAGVDSGAVDATLATILDTIGDNPPEAVLPNGKLVTQRSWDYPNVPLTISILVAAVLCASLMVLRR
jgi:hypothetical protein